MDSEHLITAARTELDAGHRIDQVAKSIVRQVPHIEATQLITVLKTARSQDMGAVSFGALSSFPLKKFLTIFWMRRVASYHPKPERKPMPR